MVQFMLISQIKQYTKLRSGSLPCTALEKDGPVEWLCLSALLFSSISAVLSDKQKWIQGTMKSMNSWKMAIFTSYFTLCEPANNWLHTRWLTDRRMDRRSLMPVAQLINSRAKKSISSISKAELQPKNISFLFLVHVSYD